MSTTRHPSSEIAPLPAAAEDEPTTDERLEALLNQVEAPPQAPPPERECEALLNQVEAPPPQREQARGAAQAESQTDVPPTLRTARVRSIAGRVAQITWLTSKESLEATVPREVDVELVRQAIDQRELVLVEYVPGERPTIVGRVQTRVPRDVVLRGETIHIESEREILLRSGRGAIRIRQDGALELLGTRIAATSRGLLRLVGRALRLN